MKIKRWVIVKSALLKGMYLSKESSIITPKFTRNPDKAITYETERACWNEILHHTNRNWRPALVIIKIKKEQIIVK